MLHPGMLVKSCHPPLVISGLSFLASPAPPTKYIEYVLPNVGVLPHEGKVAVVHGYKVLSNSPLSIC